MHLPELPHGLQLTDISIEPDKLCLSGTLQEWRVDVPRTRLEDVINQLSVVGRPLNLTRFAAGSRSTGGTPSASQVGSALRR